MIIAMFQGITGIIRISEKIKGSGNFKLYKAISKAGTKNIIAEAKKRV